MGADERGEIFSALSKEIRAFAQVDENLYRGGQPTEKGLELLKQLGVRTVINFRHEEEEIERERKSVEVLGMDYVSLPWRIQVHPSRPVMKQFLELSGESEKGPFFMHCRRGAERTSVADAVYRHYYEGLPADAAYENATRGHNTLFYWRPFMARRYRQFVNELPAHEREGSTDNTRKSLGSV